MDPKFSKFESQIKAFLDANTPIKNIINYYNISSKSIYNAIYGIKSKLKDINKQERASQGRVSKVSNRTKRVINRDITRSPRKTKKRLLRENNLNISIRTLQRVLKDEEWVINICSKK